MRAQGHLREALSRPRLRCPHRTAPRFQRVLQEGQAGDRCRLRTGRERPGRRHHAREAIPHERRACSQNPPSRSDGAHRTRRHSPRNPFDPQGRLPVRPREERDEAPRDRPVQIPYGLHVLRSMHPGPVQGSPRSEILFFAVSRSSQVLHLVPCVGSPQRGQGLRDDPEMSSDRSGRMRSKDDRIP